MGGCAVSVVRVHYCILRLWSFYVRYTVKIGYYFQQNYDVFQNQVERAVWQYGLWSFQTGGIRLERLLPKNQQDKGKLLNSENWVSGRVSKSAKSPNLLTFKVNFIYQKSSESF